MKPLRTNLTLLAFAGVLALAISACGQAADDLGAETERVATLDALAALAPTPEELPLTDSPVIFEGTMRLCATGESYEARISRVRPDGEGACDAFPMEWFIKEGSFPHVSLILDGTSYRANEVHLLRRAPEWFLYVEGSRDEYLEQEHIGNVLQIVEDDEIKLTPKCSGDLYAWHEHVTREFWLCFQNTVHTLDIALIQWEEDNSCSIDYSLCPATSA